ncbi:GPW/gp25 family protein [Sphingopyxis yananensis]|uniref:GPW/gp25 family protein n=1 Tax=Sphingopyxis yananensis TaxID=2886687 RepID=UPI001D101711|nr:GPW/gp25 family protein [Sphingopyxis yananensis]MCC2602742.1 GPW/gp25 family protein [Sphingopyxis yananensis]
MSMNQYTGEAISEADDIIQSIGRILSTRIGTRVHRRSFGSRLPELQDTPLTPRNAILWIAATAGALRRWEDRIRVERVRLSMQDGASGRLTLSIDGHRTDIPGKPPISLTIPT